MIDPAKFIGAAVVPAVMISACGLFCLAFYNRLAAIVARLRALSREKMHGEKSACRADERHSHWMRRMLSRGSRELQARARLIRNALACLLGAVLCLALCCLAGGMATVWNAFAYPALATFVAGDVFIVIGLALALWELRLALRPVEDEAHLVEAMLEIGERQHEAA